MTCTVTVDGPCRRTLEFSIEREILQQEVERQLRQVAATSHFKGFRPGKAPLEMVRRTHGRTLAEEARRRVMGQAFAAAIEEHALQPVGDPEMDLEKLKDEEGAPFTFAFAIEVVPEFELDIEERVPVTVELPALADQMVERELEVLRKRSAGLEDAPEGVLVTTNDILEGDAVYLVDGSEIASRHGVVLVEHDLVDGIQVPGAGEAFLGKVKGATVELQATLPPHFKPVEHAGREATLRFTITRHRLAVLPEPDDRAFLSRLGVSSPEELASRVREGLEAQRQAARTRLVDRALEGYLLERHTFELPQRLLSKSIDRRVHEVAHQLMERQGLSAEDGHHQAEEKRAELTSATRDGLRLAFILDRIARANELTASQEQAEEQVRQLAREQQADPEALLAASYKEGWLGDVQEQLSRQAARGWLRERAVVTEKEPQAAEAAGGGASEAAGSAGGEGAS